MEEVRRFVKLKLSHVSSGCILIFLFDRVVAKSHIRIIFSFICRRLLLLRPRLKLVNLWTDKAEDLSLQKESSSCLETSPDSTSYIAQFFGLRT